MIGGVSGLQSESGFRSSFNDVALILKDENERLEYEIDMKKKNKMNENNTIANKQKLNDKDISGYEQGINKTKQNNNNNNNNNNKSQQITTYASSFATESCQMVRDLTFNSNTSVAIAMKTSLPRQLVTFLKLVSIQNIQIPHISALCNLIYAGSDQHRHELYEMNVMQVMSDIIRGCDYDISEKIVGGMRNIVLSGSRLEDQAQEHPYKQVLEKDGVVESVFIVGFGDEEDQGRRNDQKKP
ncbi:MAG: hypothetical protein EZS28_006805 [Streblomastix strix]|uniref:Uncharacterized protein n=1 Tax=Streblomastix strix TaxID=222440 RepID=A0A5J4WU35_9EUKA|nr:MAG: hypothetical protein EZS28_006805 [Streblomastix strix]